MHVLCLALGGEVLGRGVLGPAEGVSVHFNGGTCTVSSSSNSYRGVAVHGLSKQPR